MKMLLVYPEYPDTLPRRQRFPLGLLTVASFLPDSWEKKLVDTNVEELRDEHIAWADLVFLGAMLVQSKSAAEIIGRCRHFEKKIFAVGPLFTTILKRFCIAWK